MPTRNATAGCFQSRGGEDLVHYSDESGSLVSWIGADGRNHCTDFVTEEGISVADLQNQIDTIVTSSLPSVIDCGTF